MQTSQTIFKAYMNDWPLFAREYLKVNLDPEQEEVLHAVQIYPKVAVASGTSRGKDFVAAVAAICFLYLTPRWDEKTGKLIANTKVACTGPTERQVKNIMTPELARIKNGSVYLPGVLTGNDIRTPYKEWFLTGFKADDQNLEAWSGFHAANVMYVVTEASGMADGVFDAIEGCLQGNSRLLIVFNPNIPTGYAAKAMKSSQFKKFTLNSLNALNVTSKKIIIPGQVDFIWLSERVKDWCSVIDEKDVSAIENDFEFEGRWYRPNDLFRAKVLGKFPKVSSDVLVPVEWIEIANERWKKAQADQIHDRWGNTGSTRQVIMKTKSLRLGVDVAGMGRDDSTFVFRYANYVDKIISINGGGEMIHMQIGGMVLSYMKEGLNTFSGLYPQAFIDTIGEGAGTYSRLVEVADEGQDGIVGKKGSRVFSVKFSEAAEDSGGRALTDVTGQYEFLNKRAYLYWCIRDWLDPARKTEAMLPPDEQLSQELTETKWKFRSNGKIQIEEKEEIRKRIGRSPDKADGLANTFDDAPDVDPNPKKAVNKANMFH